MNTDDIVTLGHGGGGSLTREMIDEMIVTHLGNPILARLDDGACIDMPGTSLVFTTDSYVVSPIFFPGGDIGQLSVCGTVNDLAMQGAEPLYLSLALILEEGFPLSDLARVIESIGRTAREVGVQVVTGDTKVVDRGHGNGVFINTAGIGSLRPGIDVHVRNARPGDKVIVTGTLGDHGMTVISKREGLEFESTIRSDVAPLADLAARLLKAVPEVHCLRDPTRGGLTAGLCDIAHAAGVGIRVRERAIPVRKEVDAACRLLGIDPLNVANEGKAIVICPPDRADAALEALRSHPLGADACLIGEVAADPVDMVLLETHIGGERILEMTSGEELPRIC